MIPMGCDEEGNPYCLFTYEMTPKADSDKLVDISAQIASMDIRNGLHIADSNMYKDKEEYYKKNPFFRQKIKVKTQYMSDNNLDFKKVDLSDKNILIPFFRKYGGSSCQYSIYLMTGLSMKYGDEYAIVDDVLFIHRSNLDNENTRVYLAPIGDFKGDPGHYIDMLFSDAKLHESKLSFSLVNEEFKNILEETYPDVYSFKKNRDYSEYVYLKEDLSVLSGRALAPKRNRVRAFYSTYSGNVKIEDINNNNISDVYQFQKQWIEDRFKEGYDEMLDRENEAIKFYLAHYNELEFKGIVVYIKGTVVGYAAGVSLNEECMDEVIEKGRKDITGIYQLLCNEFALICCNGYKYINREEDLGVEGLRRAKESYKPYRMIDKYSAEIKEQ